MNKGFFGGLFDLDGDGTLDTMERSLDFAAVYAMVIDEIDAEEDELLLDEDLAEDEFSV